MTDNKETTGLKRSSKRITEHMQRVPEHVRRVPEHMKRVPVKQAAKASGSVAAWIGILLLIGTCFVVSMGRWWAPMYVEAHRAEIMERISDAAGVGVSSDSMTLIWSRWGPQLEVAGLKVEGENGQIPVSLDEARFSVNVYKMFAFRKLIIDDVEVEGLHIDVLRSKTGQWRLALTSEDQPEQKGSDWFDVLSSFRWLNLQNSVLTFKDQISGRDYQVEGVTVVAHHVGGRYRIRVDGDLPERLGEELTIIADLDGASSTELSGQVYVGMEDVDLGELGNAFGSEHLEVDGQVAGLEYWQDISAGVGSKGHLQFAGDNLLVKRRSDNRPWHVELAELGLGWERVDESWDIWLDNLTLASGGEAWRSGYTRIKHSPDGGLQAQGETLRLGSISLLLAQLTDIKALQVVSDAADKYNPQGDLVAWRLMMAMQDGEPEISAFEGVVNGLSVESVDGRPGFSGIDALLRIKGSDASARVSGFDFVLDAPKIYATPLTFETLDGVLAANISKDDWSLRSENIELVFNDTTMQTAFEISKPKDYPGLALNLESTFDAITAAELPALYPVGVMRDSLVGWLNRAIKTGNFSNGKFVFRGYLPEFPFRQGDGVMTAEFEGKGMTLDYTDNWPEITEADAKFKITPTGMEVIGNGTFDGVPLQGMTVDIPEFKDGKLLLSGELDTTAEYISNFARTGPLAKTLGAAVEGLEMSGPVKLKIAPIVDLKNAENTTVEGVLTANGARLNIDAAGADLRNLTGDLPFDEKGIKDANIAAEIHGKPMTARVTRLSNGRGMQIDSRVELSASKWLRDKDIGVADYFEGVSQWRVLTRFLNDKNGKADGISVSLTSDMRGVKVLAPAPVSKGKRAQRPFRIEGRIDTKGKSKWDFGFSGDLAGRFVLDKEGELLSLAMGAGAPTPTMPLKGTRIRVDWARADVSKWYDFVDKCCMQGESSNDGYLDLFAQIGEVSWDGVPLGRMSFTAVDDETGLTGSVDGRMATGTFRYNYRVGQEAWDINFQNVNLTPFMEAEEDENAPAEIPLDPRVLPVTRWTLDRVQMSDLTIKNIRFNTSPDPRGLNLNRIIISTPDYTGNGKGSWYVDEKGKHESEIDIFLHANKLGRAAASLGRSDAISGGRGQITLALNWPDALYTPDLGVASGNVKLEMIEGRIEKVDAGAGRLFGLLALQTLPQRLALDFSDLGEGLSYTQVKGEFALANGVAQTRYMMLEGPIGTVSVEGNIDYARRRFDQKVMILPNVGGTLPMIGAVVGGPVTAAGVFLADKIFRSVGLDVNKIGRRDYSLTGSFDDPQFTPLAR